MVAFFPCIYFETIQQLYFSFDSLNNRNKPQYDRVNDAIIRLQERNRFHTLLYQLIYITERLNLRLVIENPATKPSYLIDTQNLPKPQIIDNNRMERGDYFRKPTAYWFFGCEPTHGFTYQNDKDPKTILQSKSSGQAGLCSEDRSLMSPDYARNWICDFVLGKVQNNIGQQYFDFVS